MAAKASLVASASRDAFVRREAELLALTGSPQAALTKAAEAVSLGPKDASNYLVLANIQRSAGNIEDTQATLDRALHEVEKSSSTLLLRASELSLMQRQPAAALTLAQRAIAVGSADPWAFSHLATLLESIGDTQGALATAHKAATLLFSGRGSRLPGLMVDMDRMRNPR